MRVPGSSLYAPYSRSPALRPAGIFTAADRSCCCRVALYTVLVFLLDFAAFGFSLVLTRNPVAHRAASQRRTTVDVDVTGVVVGLTDESWPASGERPGGRRVVLYIQGDLRGLSAPMGIVIDDPWRGGVSKARMGDAAAVPVHAVTFAGSRDIVMRARGDVLVTSQRAAA